MVGVDRIITMSITITIVFILLFVLKPPCSQESCRVSVGEEELGRGRQVEVEDFRGVRGVTPWKVRWPCSKIGHTQIGPQIQFFFIGYPKQSFIFSNFTLSSGSDIFHEFWRYIHTYVPTNVQTFIHTYMHACMHACIHAHIHTDIHTCMHACIHAHIHTHMHKHIHTLHR